MIPRSRLLLLATFACLTTAGPLAAAEWKAGVASVVITPEEPTWLSGYSNRTKPAEGKVHDLFAKALAVTAEGETLVVVTLDLGSVSAREITDPVAERVKQRYGLARAGLILNVSHTHCAPEVAEERRVFHDLSTAEEEKLGRYISRLCETLTALVGAALEDRKPARLLVSRSHAEFAKNRRFPTPGGYVNQRYDAGPVDHEVPVLQVRDDQGALRAVLFGYACHNTTLAFYQYCGDYAGFAQEQLQRQHPGATALFFMGCGGDQNPYPRHGEHGLEYARQHGGELARGVERALAGEAVEITSTLRTAYAEAVLDLEPLPTAEQLRSDATSATDHRQRKAKFLLGLLQNGGRVPLTQTCPVHAARLGEQLLLIGIGGETVVDYSLKCKAEFAGPFVWVAGYCDDVFAYLPSRRVLLEGGYEGRSGIVHQRVATPFTESVEDRVMGAVRKTVAEVSRR